MPGPYIAQICMNGHITARNIQTSPLFMRKYCEQCGEPTITACPHCQVPIRGEYQNGFIVLGIPELPAQLYCHNCGHPYPWTERRVQAIKDLIDGLAELTPADRKKLRSSFGDLLADTSRTELAATSWKLILGKLAPPTYEAVKALAFEVITPVARSLIFCML